METRPPFGSPRKQSRPSRRSVSGMHDFDVNGPTFCFDDDRFDWKMSRWEKYAFSSLLAARKPAIALEVGTFRGGSLQLLATHSGLVYSIDINPRCRRTLKRSYTNVQFLVGDSRRVLPELLAHLHSERQSLGFVLIDGDHTERGVAADITSILRTPPICELLLLIHDSFNPECRRGILSVDWRSCQYVHYVDVDFVPGAFYPQAFSNTEARSMWGGFALARLMPNARTGHLPVKQSQKRAFEIVRAKSRHAPCSARNLSKGGAETTSAKA